MFNVKSKLIFFFYILKHSKLIIIMYIIYSSQYSTLLPNKIVLKLLEPIFDAFTCYAGPFTTK